LGFCRNLRIDVRIIANHVCFKDELTAGTIQAIADKVRPKLATDTHGHTQTLKNKWPLVAEEAID
jgi:hypothetical protein